MNFGFPTAVGLFAAVLLFGLAPMRAADAQTPPGPSERAAYVGLHAAALAGDVAAIRRLVAGGADANARDGRARTPLMVAAHYRRHAAASALIEGGGDLGALDFQRYDVVTIAAVLNDAAMVRLALGAGASAGLITSPYEGTALIAAAHLGHVSEVRALIKGGAPLDHVNNLGWTALIEAIVLGDGGPDHVACVRALVDAGAKLDLADATGARPLALARARGYADIVRILESAGARP